VRHSDALGEVTLKDTASATAGLRKRVEITEPLPEDGIETLGTEGPVGRRIRALPGGRALRPVLEVRTARQPYDLLVGRETVAEVALDETAISAGDGQRPTHLYRVEVEVVPRWVEALAPLVEQLRGSCGLQPATLSKFEAGLLAAGLEIPGPPDLGLKQLPPSPSVGDVAYVVLRRNLAAMVAHEPGTRLGEDFEELHDMRVATRRMRAALAMFSEALPVRAQHVRDELGWLGRMLGAVRDLDVQLERLEEWAGELPEEDERALDELAGLLGHEREVARDELLSCLESLRYEQLVSDFSDMLRQGPPLCSAARAPAVAVVPDLVQSRQRSAAKAAKRARHSGAADDFHQLRIRCKRLRYALEFVSEIYEGQTANMVSRVVRLQDALGFMQDARVAATRLHDLATADTTGLSPITVFAMGGVAGRYRQEAERVRRSLPGHLKDLKGSHWQKLKILMERKQLELDTLNGWPLPPPQAQTVVDDQAWEDGSAPPLQ
jgi:CHAD domain-containing protein